ncbi:hypothetical protein PoB_001036900 [Plakobranchus ocellatus]|uniref:Transposase Tc1-like domain-containing protein n=1 Tax=Plakobranchus ocellatus TaxID=259542 RepID=A0AAV3YLF1_9GAST|nr:hypothetical protein PoB_001036900 [Plakobranchus ocellatus]
MFSFVTTHYLQPVGMFSTTRSDHRLTTFWQTKNYHTCGGPLYAIAASVQSFPHSTINSHIFQGPRNISRDTILRCLHEVGLHPHRPAIRPRLTQVHRRNRLQRAIRHQRWTMRQ